MIVAGFIFDAKRGSLSSLIAAGCPIVASTGRSLATPGPASDGPRYPDVSRAIMSRRHVVTM